MKYPESAKRIRKALDDEHMSQQELSNRTGITKGSISQYVNGSHSPSNRTAYLMGKVLHVSPAWLMGLDVPRKQIDYTLLRNNDSYDIDMLSRIESLTPEQKSIIVRMIEQMEGNNGKGN